jgi:hypothetical protein
MPTKLTTDQVNYLNIALMLLAAALAFLLPFELFLVAYAVLGPLHYLTEISWLHDRRYFTAGEYDKLILPALAILATILIYLDADSDPLAAGVGIAGLGIALTMFLFKDWLRRLLGTIIVIVLAFSFARGETVQVLFGLFLPSVIHVIVFTAAFMLYGALKGRSRSGYSSVAIYALCLASFFVIHPDTSGYRVGDYIRSSYAQFEALSIWLMAMMKLHPPDKYPDPFDLSNGAMVIIRLLAFGYTYHYMNWFSKTSVIQWHNIPRSRLIAIIVLWLASIGVYAYDYNIGLVTLFLLSYLHVMLEFPLNHQSIIGIGKELRVIWGKQTGMVQPATQRAGRPPK